MSADFVPSEKGLFSEEMRSRLERVALGPYLQRSRWFGGKARGLEAVVVREMAPFTADAGVALVEARYGDGAVELYQVPLVLGVRAGLDAVDLVDEVDGMVVADALYSARFRAELWARLGIAGGAAPPSRVLAAEQSNSSLLYGQAGGQVFVKVMRRVVAGMNPEAEILRFLAEERRFAHVPAFCGALEWPLADGSGPALLALAVSAVPNRGDAWHFVLGVLGGGQGGSGGTGDDGFYARAAAAEARGCRAGELEVVRALAGEGFLARLTQLGERTGRLHLALGGPTQNAAFSPEPMTAGDWGSLQTSVLARLEEVREVVPAGSCAAVEARVRELAGRPVVAAKTRTHGDYHLGQVLETGGDFVIIDFEGEPARPLAERRGKQSPVRDVAGMLRSLHYAAHAARPEEWAGSEAWAEAWTDLAGAAFLEGWRETVRGAGFCPDGDGELERMLGGFLLEKVLYEIGYERGNRPGWVGIPLRGLERVLRLR